jgi:nitroreductase
MMLAAVEHGLAGCMLGSVKRDRLKTLLELGEGLEIMLVIALGKPVESVVLEEVGPSGSIKYYRDEKGVHHVPKRSLDEILLRML